MPTTITFASLLDPAGVVIAAGIITGLVELLKTTFPALDALTALHPGRRHP